MGQLRRGNRDLIKAINRNLVLNTIRIHGPLSRTQLTELTGLSVGAVSQITNDLLEESWIIETGEGESTGGRPQILLRLNPTAAYAVGLKLMEDRIVCALTNLEIEELSYLERPLPGRSPEAVVSAIANIVHEVIFKAGISSRQVLGVGIGLAGVVNTQTGVVHYSPFFKWHEIPIGEQVAAQLQIPVHLSNDVNTLTVTEKLFGEGYDAENFAVVTIGRGIGVGMLLHSQLYEGGPGGAGELGHLTLEVDGPLCDCGKRGCLEALASDPAVLQQIEAALENGAVSSLQSPATLQSITAAADQGDKLAQDVLATSGAYIGQGISAIVNLLCPSLIIISGEGVIAGDHRIKPLLESLRNHSFNGLLENVRIIVKPTDDATWARGAAGLVVSKFFESPLVKQPETV